MLITGLNRGEKQNTDNRVFGYKCKEDTTDRYVPDAGRMALMLNW